MPADPPAGPPRALTVRLDPGLYLVATPIGTARDITLRALDTLASAEVLAAEDTRSLRRLMEMHGVPLAGRPLLAYHEHNDATARPRLMAALSDGRTVAFAAEAGTPLVSDPGFQLVRAAAAAGHRVHTVPGASAALAALTVAGLPTDRFLFAGFAPARGAARTTFLRGLAGIEATVVLYEAPGRVRDLLGKLCETFGDQRRAALCRELTKRFEEVARGTLGSLASDFADRNLKGEVVVVVDRAAPEEATAADLDAALRTALAAASVRDAANAVAGALGLPRREVYRRALALLGGIGT